MTTNRTANQEKALSIKESSIIISNDEQNLSHNEGLESERKPGKLVFDWQIISIKIVCFVLIVISWLIVATPYASLVRYFLSSDINTTNSANTQKERIDSMCSVINNSTLGFRGNRSFNLNLKCALYHYTTMVFFFWYVSYIIAVLLILSFPIKMRLTESSNWKPHLIIFLVSTLVPLLILAVFWAVDPIRYEIVNHPSVCFPSPTATVVMFVIPITLTLGLSLTSVLLIVCQLIINRMKLRRYITSDMNKNQTQFIIRTLGVIITFTIIALFILLEFGIRVSFIRPYNSYVELYWACITRYGTNTSCCVDNYTQFYNSTLGVLNYFFISIWGMMAFSTLAVKEAREFWIDLFSKCFSCCYNRIRLFSKPEPSSCTPFQPKKQVTQVEVEMLPSSEGYNILSTIKTWIPFK